MHDRRLTYAPFAASFVLGFALSGFFDGVLLHQILQWHHLLSLVEAEAVKDLRVQVFADGAFHAMMYVVAVVGLVMLWRGRDGLAEPGGSRRFWVGLALGFGAWNVVDVVVFHWILNFHHIRLDVVDPIAWDIGWLIAFGAIPILLALFLARRGGGSNGRVVAAGAIAAILVTGAWNMKPPSGGADTLVLLAPGVDAMTTVLAADAKLIDLDRSGSLAVVRLRPGANPWRLYRHGALMVQGAGPSACFSWARPPAA